MKRCLGIIFFRSLLHVRASIPRFVRISGQQFVVSETLKPIVLSGPNVVVKGPPYLPSVQGSTICNDVVNDECTATGSCISCSTFNQADVDHIKDLGWNSIRLGGLLAAPQINPAGSQTPTQF